MCKQLQMFVTSGDNASKLYNMVTKPNQNNINNSKLNGMLHAEIELLKTVLLIKQFPCTLCGSWLGIVGFYCNQDAAVCQNFSSGVWAL